MLSTVGGNDVGDVVRRMMRRVMTNQLMAQFTVRGKTGKMKFSQQPLFRILISEYYKSS